MFDSGQRRLVDVAEWNVPPRRKPGLVLDQPPPAIGDQAIFVANHKVA